jgi:hypothetical protein
MDCDELDDWLTQHGRMRFYIPEHNPDSYSKVTDVYGTFEKGEYEYYHMETICCSLCDAGVEVFDHTPPRKRFLVGPPNPDNWIEPFECYQVKVTNVRKADLGTIFWDPRTKHIPTGRPPTICDIECPCGMQVSVTHDQWIELVCGNCNAELYRINPA